MFAVKLELEVTLEKRRKGGLWLSPHTLSLVTVPGSCEGRALPAESGLDPRPLPATLGHFKEGPTPQSGPIPVTPLPLARNRTGLPDLLPRMPVSAGDPTIAGNNTSVLATRSKERKPFSKRDLEREKDREPMEARLEDRQEGMFQSCLAEVIDQ